VTEPIAVPREPICPSCGKTDKTLWPEGCNNEWHREEWERLQQELADERLAFNHANEVNGKLQQENAKLREALKEARPYLYETLDAPIDVRNKVSDALQEASK
jgi:hypothetical protein